MKKSRLWTKSGPFSVMDNSGHDSEAFPEIFFNIWKHFLISGNGFRKFFCALTRIFWISNFKNPLSHARKVCLYGLKLHLRWWFIWVTKNVVTNMTMIWPLALKWNSAYSSGCGVNTEIHSNPWEYFISFEWSNVCQNCSKAPRWDSLTITNFWGQILPF